MRLYMILPGLEPALVRRPSVCPRCGCQAEQMKHHQRVVKPVQDTGNNHVPTSRYRCPQCGHTFRAYPQGVGRAALSQRLKNVAVLLHLLGLSYQSVEAALEALGLYVSKTRICAAVQEARETAPSLERHAVFSRIQVPQPAKALRPVKSPARGTRPPRLAEPIACGPGDGIRVRCEERWLTLRLAAADATGLVLLVDDMPAGLAEGLKDWCRSLQGTLDVRLLFDGDGGAL